MELSLKKQFELERSIFPQTFYVHNNILFYYDKINKHEGRLCKVDGSKTEILYEYADDLGFISGQGKVYAIRFGKETRVREIELEGTVSREFLLEGTFFDTARDESGNTIFLGLRNGKSCIEIFSVAGFSMKTLYFENLLLACGIAVISENLIFGGISKDQSLKLYEVNYAGIKINEWVIFKNSNNRTIEKILSYGNFVTLLIRDKESKVFVLNRSSGELRDITIESINRFNISDINIIGNSTYFLIGREVLKTDTEVLVSAGLTYHRRKLFLDPSIFCYAYNLLGAEIYQNFISFANQSVFWAAILGSFSFLAIMNPFRVYQGLLVKLLFVVFIIDFLTVLIKSRFTLANKVKRINRLLVLNNDLSYKWAFSQLYLGLILFCTLDIVSDYTSYIAFHLLSILIIFEGIGFLTINNIRKNQDRYIVELLEEENNDIVRNIKDFLEKCSGSVRFAVHIKAEKPIGKWAFRDWVDSRKYIIMNEVEFLPGEKSVTIILDISKRNMKYSKFSILMDLICFIKTKIAHCEIELYSSREKLSINMKSEAK